MNRSRFSEEQIIGILRESAEASTIREVFAKHNMSEARRLKWLVRNQILKEVNGI